MAGRVEQSPVGADAAFKNLPRLIDRFDDVVVDAECLGARDKVAQHFRLFDTARNRVLQVIAGARPAELGDHDAFAGIGLAQLVVDQNRLVDALLGGKAFPVGQDVRGNVVHRRDQLGMLHPHMPDFAGGDRHVGRALDPLDHLDQVGNGLLAAVDGFVADEDAVDVAVAVGEVDDRTDLALVTVFVLIDPGADGHAQAEFGCDSGHHLDPGGRRIGANRPRQRRQKLQVGANLLDFGPAAFVGIGGTRKRRIRDAGEGPFNVGRTQVCLRESPQAGLYARHEGGDGNDGAHSALEPTGAGWRTCEPVPWAHPNHRFCAVR